MVDQPILDAQQKMAAGRADLAIDVLEKVTRQQPRNQAAWKMLGFAYHEEQLEPEAAEALNEAVMLDRGDVAASMALAQSRLMSGQSAVRAFRRVLRDVPDDLNTVRGYADALLAQGRRGDAEAVLRDALRKTPGWLAGHKSLASLVYTSGDQRRFADSYVEACKAEPANLALRLEWFRTVAQTRDWQEATRIVEEGERAFGPHPQLKIAALFVASESGDDRQATQLLAETESLDDIVRDMALVRFSLRTGDVVKAEPAAEKYVGTASAAVMWPYLSLIWRLRDDPRAQWLDGSPPMISAVDIEFDDDELDRLARLLREMHMARSPYMEQSVRGGTQTDLNLFLRREPILRTLKTRIQAAVRDYVRDLPPRAEGHPLLDADLEEMRRGRVLFSGSWSVRLQPGGYNVSHTHPVGLVSSALYVSLPDAAQMGKPPAGWIQFGTPPAELGLDLEPYGRVEPRTGRLVLFPSTMWHSTVPFDDGERLVVAFDVRPPRASPESRTRDSAGQLHE